MLKYNDFSNSDIIIEVINGPYWDFLLNEGFDFEYYNKSKDIKIDNDHKIKLQQIEDLIEQKLDEINPVQGKFYNDRVQRTRTIDFTLITTQHWYVKFFRKYFEDQRLVDPNLFDGINIIVNNIDEITRQIDLCLIGNDYRVMIRSKEFPMYNQVVIFERINPSKYNITLQTQLKGRPYVDKDVKRDVKLSINKNVTT